MSYETEVGPSTVPGVTKNLSRAGVLVQCTCSPGAVPAEGTSLTVDIEVEGAKRFLTCMGALAWTQEQPGGERLLGVYVVDMEFRDRRTAGIQTGRAMLRPPLVM